MMLCCVPRALGEVGGGDDGGVGEWDGSSGRPSSGRCASGDGVGRLLELFVDA